jgi:tetraacyldisaccharide 4'-kinase
VNARERYLRIISGEASGPAAAAGRAGLAMLSPLYGTAIRLRNWSFDRGWRQKALPRPTVSVGNLTVGGTGKTPVVAWLCDALRRRGRHPAVLMRGYKAPPGQKGDEQRLLEQELGTSVPIAADPDRGRGAQRILAASPDVDVFVLDDGFQHRSIRRQVDLVLVDATCPFGHGRLLPRGLLREPVSSLRRATAILITRAERAEDVAELRRSIRGRSAAPVFSCRFAVDRIVDSGGGAISSIAGRKVLAVCGIGNPGSFLETVRRQGGDIAGELIFADHHGYTPRDVEQIIGAAQQRDALAITTAKDWVKLSPLWPTSAAANIAVLEQRVVFPGGEEDKLLNVILQAMDRASKSP